MFKQKKYQKEKPPGVWPPPPLEEKEELKIYVWEEDFLTDYVSGLAVVIASSENEAKEILKAQILKVTADNYGVDYKVIEERIKKRNTLSASIDQSDIKAIDEGPDKVYDISKKAFWIAGGA